MSKDFEKIDELIKEALTQEEAKFYDKLDEQGLFHKMKGVFMGKLGWLVAIMNIMHLLVFGVFVYCCIQFFEVEEVNMLIKWGFGCMACLVAMSMMKMFTWMQMDKNSIIRELKRLELQVSTLSSKDKD